MINTIRIIPSLRQYSPALDMFASATGSKLSNDSFLVESGYTWETIDHNGSMTIGLGRRDVKTKAEALSIAKATRYKLI